MTAHDWLLVGILAFQTGLQVLMRIDQWVHRSTEDTSSHGDRLLKIERRLEDASVRSSEKESRLTYHLGEIDLALREIQTVLGLGYGRSQKQQT